MGSGLSLTDFQHRFAIRRPAPLRISTWQEPQAITNSLYTLTPYDPALEEEIAAGRAFMRNFKDTFHQLAK